MADSITENVQKTVEEMVGSDRSTLSISELSESGHRSLAHFEEFVSEGKARNLFLKGIDSSQLRYECEYAFDEWEDQELLEYNVIDTVDNCSEGKVVKYNRERGFGFILDLHTNNNLFFHISNFPFNEARIGQKVKYEIANSPKGQNAINIKVI